MSDVEESMVGLAEASEVDPIISQVGTTNGEAADFRDGDLSSELEALAIQEANAVSVKIDDTEPSDPRVQVLRKRISSELSSLLSDADCLRFLRARNYNIDKATDMIEKWGVWWSTPLPGTDVLPKDAASKPDEYEEIYKEWMPHANLGETKDGHPIYWEKTGQISSVFWQIKKLLKEDDLFVRHIRQQEVMIRRLKNASLRHNKQIEKQVIVMDMKNVALTPDVMAARVFRRTVVIDEAAYPERLETLYMINAPFTFSILWALIKPWIDPVTVQKFQIIGSNFQDILKDKIAEDQIPVEYGGTCESFGWTFPDNISVEDRLKESSEDGAAIAAGTVATETGDLASDNSESSDHNEEPESLPETD